RKFFLASAQLKKKIPEFIEKMRVAAQPVPDRKLEGFEYPPGGSEINAILDNVRHPTAIEMPSKSAPITTALAHRIRAPEKTLRVVPLCTERTVWTFPP